MVMTKTTPNDRAADRQENRDRLLIAALPHIAFDGWTEKAFQTGIAHSGMQTSDFRRYFPGGVADAIGHFSDWADRQMEAKLGECNLDELAVRRRVATAVRLRFESLTPYREAVRRTLSLLSLPVNLALGARCLYRTVDCVWHAIGDRSVDFNFYTKRALLAGVVSATTLYWLDDTSENSEESWSFLDRRIEDVMRVPKLTKRLRSTLSHLPDPLGVLRSRRNRQAI